MAKVSRGQPRFRINIYSNVSLKELIFCLKNVVLLCSQALSNDQKSFALKCHFYPQSRPHNRKCI